MASINPLTKLTLRDVLSHLNFEKACKLLGGDGKQMLRRGTYADINLKDHVTLTDNEMVLDRADSTGPIRVTLTFDPGAKGRIRLHCDRCFGVCNHLATAISCVLENKTALGLAAKPAERGPVAPLSEEDLVARALAERMERAKSEKMAIKSANRETPWTDYVVTSAASGKSYQVSLRGLKPGEAYCSCPDFRTNTLGTCKHILKTASAVRRKFNDSELRAPFRQKLIEVMLEYGQDLSLRVAAPAKLSAPAADLVKPCLAKKELRPTQVLKLLRGLDGISQDYYVWPDAEELIQQQLHSERLAEKVEQIRKSASKHPLRTSLLKIPLLPYQLEGIAFVVGAGRAVLADDMGLGKTIQAVGAAELFAREAGIRRTLVICPASLKSQWKNEIRRYCDRDVQLIEGPVSERGAQYGNDCFFTVCNYEQVLKDILAIEQTEWDLIILDEGQRIKNWESKTSRVIKALKSRFALVLSGTPLENRLEELYSVVQFIDGRRLGPGFRFFNEHRIVDEKGKTLGYQNLDALRQRLKPILLRRTRESVKLEVPERTTEIIRIQPTDEQKALHDSHMQTVAQIVAKKFLTEMDLLRLRMSLLMCRMSANGTFLVTKEEPNWSSKIERLRELVEDIADEEDRKVVLFSEWTTMLDLIEPILQKANLGYVRLDGSVPQKRRQDLVSEFQGDPKCRFFLSTNAGSTGLNLQAGNTLINVDLPWNPAVLEQRIGRIHRMGQNRPVQVFILVTEKTLEENLLATLSAKKDLALAALDSESTVDSVKIASGSEDLKKKLEILLGAKPPADEDRTEEAKQRMEVERRQRVSAAAGEMFQSVFHFLGELVEQPKDVAPPSDAMVRQFRERLDSCVQTDETGKPQLTITLPDGKVLDNLARTLANFLARSTGG